MTYKLRILSLGAGVQSSALLLMSERGELPPLDCAIFADTGWESKGTYLWLDWLRAVTKVPILIVQRGSVKDFLNYNGKARAVSLPVFTMDRDDGKVGRFWRQCTGEHKIQPIRKEVRRLLGIQPRQRTPKGAVEQWIGISIDEAHRVFSRQPDRLSDLRYPLIEKRMSRTDCEAWLTRNYGMVPPKSSCIGCPFHSDREWRNLDADEFRDACEFDEMIRVRGGIRGDLFLHRSCKPLGDIDFRTIHDRLGQTTFDFMKNEKLNLFVNRMSIYGGDP